MISESIKQLIKEQYKRNHTEELQKADPLKIVHQYKKEPHIDKIALVCALLAYGNVHQILRTLESLDFSLLVASDKKILSTKFPYYRFQTQQDIQMLFIALSKINLKQAFIHGIQSHNILTGISHMQKSLYDAVPHYSTRGFTFLIGQINGQSPLKRWNLFLRWAVRKDCLDIGFWEGVIPCSELLLPLDTHSSRIARKLGLLKRKSNDIKAVLEVSHNLKQLDSSDPIKYDFALYRIGQERLLG
ncbi:TIGR02757 family protein [Helicobacter monodelphidis]|uniref:TIGR02757 family protein n=1 Tax=Helicobacter sp. 15-1451 TaxID=2004995 RepID=UPI000DCB915D|nr:TIGR02757 family protein [Helicobacter sp. 15-1451]RAX58669.1 TIGR02757 family protein [Helicobacter sp. 15-1451]